jgi:hypothetical protein
VTGRDTVMPFDIFMSFKSVNDVFGWYNMFLPFGIRNFLKVRVNTMVDLLGTYIPPASVSSTLTRRAE